MTPEGLVDAAAGWERLRTLVSQAVASPDFDEMERNYKLVVAERLRNAIAEAARTEPTWLATLEEALGPPNNLTDWRANDTLLTWAQDAANTETARAAIAEFAGQRPPAERFERFAEGVRGSPLQPGNVLALGSLFNFAIEPEALPVMRTSVMRSAALEIGAPDASRLAPAERYRAYLELFERTKERLQSEGVVVRDMLDVQGAVYAAVTEIRHQSQRPASSSVRLLSDADDLSAAEDLLRERFAEGAIHSTTGTVGFQGGNESGVEVFWHERLGLWGSIDGLPELIPTRFWNGFGTQNPGLTRNLDIVCEVNPAREEVNRQLGGAFGLDEESGHTLLLHRGKIGGGKAGVGTATFWANTTLPAVMEAGRPDQRLVVVADLDGDDVPAQIARFVKEVERIKAGVGASNDVSDEGVVRTATSPSGLAPRYWWVNQGGSYEQESAGGYLWAPVRSRSGSELAHHRALADLQPGDMVFHYQAGVRAVGEVTEPAVLADYPAEPDGSGDSGRLVTVAYTPLEEALPLARIPVAWRIEEGGPFTSTGGVKQGYLYSVTVEFARRLAGLHTQIEGMLGIEPDPTGVMQEVVTDLPTIAAAIEAEGLRLDARTVRRFHLAVQVRGFVILSGISGTGKTWLAEAYARAVHGELLLVPVAPNWNTNEDLLGYLNPLDGEYHDTAFGRFVRASAADWQAAEMEQRPARPFFLVLDEMNLARVEYYFAQFLSVLEIRNRSGVGKLHLGHEEVRIGGNLKFIGTVNVDETTHAFADKVYDRAQLIELAAPREALAAHIGEQPHGADLLAVWDALHEVAPFAFRVVDEIDGYVRASAALDVPWTDALDEQLLQKVLPKVRGLDPAAGQALEAFLAATDPDRYPLSRAKATEMLNRFNQHGSVSYFS